MWYTDTNRDDWIRTSGPERSAKNARVICRHIVIIKKLILIKFYQIKISLKHLDDWSIQDEVLPSGRIYLSCDRWWFYHRPRITGFGRSRYLRDSSTSTIASTLERKKELCMLPLPRRKHRVKPTTKRLNAGGGRSLVDGNCTMQYPCCYLETILQPKSHCYYLPLALRFPTNPSCRNAQHRTMCYAVGRGIMVKQKKQTFTKAEMFIYSLPNLHSRTARGVNRLGNHHPSGPASEGKLTSTNI